MNAVALNNLWAYLQGLSLTADNRKWLAARLVKPATKPHPVLQTWTEAMNDLDESEKEFERGEVLSGEDFNAKCQALLDSFASKTCK